MTAPVAVDAALAAWAAAVEPGALPPPVRARVEDLLLDAIASAFAGRTQSLLERVDAPLRAFGGPGTATVIGGEPASPAAASLLNAYAITSATVCDVYRPALCHVTPVSVPPLLHLAVERDASRGALLAAFAVALELTVRLARALDYPSTRSRGWHSPGVVGPVGAAAGAARIMRLDPEGVRNALAHGAAQASGTFAALGTEAVKFTQARAAAAALLSALMADAGLEAAPRWLTDPDGGMAVVYSSAAEPERALAGLGEEWELTAISLRRWPAASSVQSLIDACLELRARGVAPAAVERVEVELGPAAFEVSGGRPWRDPLGAQQSASWVAAAVLEDGDWWVEQSSPARIADERLSAFAAERVSVGAAPDLGSAGVRVRVLLEGGHEEAASRTDAPGDPALPLTRGQIEEKLRRAAGARGLDAAAEGTIAFVRDGADSQPAAPFVRLLGAV